MQASLFRDALRTSIGLMPDFRFWLGVHKPQWLDLTDVPLFISRRTLADYLGRARRHAWEDGVCERCAKPRRRGAGTCEVRDPRPRGPWALDSGGFTELQMYGRWTISAAEYAAEVLSFQERIGRLEWAAPQDWMCEPIVRHGGTVRGSKGKIVFAGTHKTVAEHQRLTVDNLLELRALTGGKVRWTPVVQGWTLGEYLDHVELYEKAGVDLRLEPIVGVGSVCRRQGEIAALSIMRTLAGLGLRIHAFGFKTEGLVLAADVLASADSMAWSEYWSHRLIDGHNKPGGRPRPRGHKNCANCLEAALLWREWLLARDARRMGFAA